MGFSFKKIIWNIYIKNFILMVIVFVAIVFGVLFGLDSYTKHNQTINVPSLKGLQIEEAAAILQSAGLSYEVVDSVFERRGVPGSILEQIQKENSKVKEGRTIYLIVQAKSEPMVSIPDLTDYTQRQAEALLNALGFANIKVEEVSSEYRGLVQSIEFKGAPLSVGQKIPKGAVLCMKVGDGNMGIVEEPDSLFETMEEYLLDD